MFQFEIEDTVVDGGNPKGNASSGSVEDIGFKMGDRIISDKDLGVVKYIGAVGSHPGVWLGIEWDDSSRGKHSGTVDGVQYFESSVPNGASFIRVTKAKRLKRILEALQERYGQDDNVMSTLKSIEDRLEKKKISYSKLKVLNLTSRGINDLTEYDELARLCPNVEVLEISDNLIRDWDSVGNLCLALPKLIRVDLSRNPLIAPSGEAIIRHNKSFSKLQHVVLGNVGYTWDIILEASEMWPQINNLTVPFNTISRILSPIRALLSLQSIDLEKNMISDWEDVLKLGVLQSLEYINLCGNQISRIRMPSNTTISCFPNLTRLNITENVIDDWISVSELNKLKHLQELRIDVNPFLNHNKRATNRQIIIARIEQLQKLEGVDIHRQERRDAELDYVKLFSQQWVNMANRPQFVLEHPLYPALVIKFGQSDAGEQKKESHSMKSSLINLIIVPESSIAYKECEKKILKTMTVQKLKALLQRMFRIPAVPIEITVTSCRNPEITFVLENNFFEIGKYSIEDGDTLRLRW